MIVNTTQAAAWNGQTGTHWADHHDRYDTMAAGFDGPLFAAAALDETSRVLDIGCGTGATTRQAARLARRGEAVGIDLSAPMLDRARGLAAEEGLGNAMFVQGDAQAHTFPSAHFDVAISRAGVMFFADPVAAFANIRLALAPDGRLAFLTHRSVVHRYQAIRDALGEHLPPAAGTPGAASFADPEHVRGVLAAAGFHDVVAEPVEVLSVLGRDADDATDFLFGGALGDLADANAARTDVHRALRAAERDGAVRLPAGGWLHTASVR